MQHRVRSEGYLLLNFARYADRHGGPLTNKLAITWARLPKASNRSCWARRLEAVRRLAKYLATTDSKTELPPRHLFGPSKQPYQPFLYSAKQIAQLLMAAGQLPGELRPYTYQTLIGLLACTGLRVSEALHLKVPEVDLQQGLLLVREGKFHRTRWVPLDPTALRPLHLYNQQRQKRFPLAEHFFASESGATLRYSTVHAVFSRLSLKRNTEIKMRVTSPNTFSTGAWNTGMVLVQDFEHPDHAAPLLAERQTARRQQLLARFLTLSPQAAGYCSVAAASTSEGDASAVRLAWSCGRELWGALSNPSQYDREASTM